MYVTNPMRRRRIFLVAAIALWCLPAAGAVHCPQPGLPEYPAHLVEPIPGALLHLASGNLLRRREDLNL
jgi:hypothetical protein